MIDMNAEARAQYQEEEAERRLYMDCWNRVQLNR